MGRIFLALAHFFIIQSCLGPGDAEENSPQLPTITSITESEFLTSNLWKDEELKVFMLRDDGETPSDYLDALLAANSSIPIVKVICSGPGDGGDGDICSTLASQDIVVKQGGKKKEGKGEEGVIGADFPFQKYKSTLEFVRDALELMVGRDLTHISSFSALVSFMEKSDSLLVLAQDTSTNEYISLLKTYLSSQDLVLPPLGVVGSKTSLPLERRPLHTKKEPPLYMWLVEQSGNNWYKCRDVKSIGGFISRFQYPAKISTDDMDKYKQKGIHYIVFFPALPGASNLALHQLVEKVINMVFYSSIVIVADRERDSDLAQRVFVTTKKSLPQAVILPDGLETGLTSLDIQSDDINLEAYYVAEVLRSAIEGRDEKERPDDGGDEEGGDGGGVGEHPNFSVIDLAGLKGYIKNGKFDIVASLCKKGGERCIDDSYSALYNARNILKKDEHVKPLHLFTVECTLADIVKFKINILPAFAFYNSTEKVWLKGKGDLYNYRDILSLIAKATGRSELLEIPLNDYDNELDSDLPPSLMEDDTYGILARTLPLSDLPTELVLTADIFETRLQEFDKTAVLFYLGWSIESKIVLHHLLAAWELLDKSQNVTFGAVGCEVYTTICARYGVTTFPTLLTFTPSTLDSPSSPPSVGVLDSVRLLQALGQGEELENGDTTLVEATPSSLPILLRKNLATPLVLWCDDDASSELGLAFGEIALSEVYRRKISFAWLNSSEHKDILVALGSEDHTHPSVMAFLFDKHLLYQMDLQLQVSSFREEFASFLDGLLQGTLTPTRNLLHKEWVPSQPPIPFPSNISHHDDDDLREDHGDHGDYGDNEAEERFDGGNSILETVPLAQPPEVKEYPIKYEDQEREEL